MATFVYKQRLGVPGDFVYELTAGGPERMFREVPLGRVVEHSAPAAPRGSAWSVVFLDGTTYGAMFLTRYQASMFLHGFYRPMPEPGSEDGVVRNLPLAPWPETGEKDAA